MLTTTPREGNASDDVDLIAVMGVMGGFMQPQVRVVCSALLVLTVFGGGQYRWRFKLHDGVSG